jgi:hypothetical protein
MFKFFVVSTLPILKEPVKTLIKHVQSVRLLCLLLGGFNPPYKSENFIRVDAIHNLESILLQSLENIAH